MDERLLWFPALWAKSAVLGVTVASAHWCPRTALPCCTRGGPREGRNTEVQQPDMSLECMFHSPQGLLLLGILSLHQKGPHRKNIFPLKPHLRNTLEDWYLK